MTDSAAIAALQVRVAHLESQITNIADDVRAVRDALAEIRGGKKALWVVWSVLGMGLTAVATFFTIRGVG